MIRTQLQEAIKEALAKQGIDNIDVQIDAPTNTQFGDYTTNVALTAAKQLGKSPIEVAESLKLEIVRQLADWKLEIFDKVEIAGPGFINFWVSREELLKLINLYSSSE